MFPNGTHPIPHDDPQAFNAAVDRFLKTPFRRIDRIPDTMGSFDRLSAELANQAAPAAPPRTNPAPTQNRINRSSHARSVGGHSSPNSRAAAASNTGPRSR